LDGLFFNKLEMGALIGTPIFRKCSSINEFSKSLVVQRVLNNSLKFSGLPITVLPGGMFLWIFG